MIKFLDLKAQYEAIKPEIDQAIAAVIADTAFVAGPFATAFEQRFAEFQQAGHCVGVGNGTDAIEIVLEALTLPPGSEVIVPANSFIASSEAVTRAGHRVVFADADPRTHTLDPVDVARRVTDRTGAIIAVHLYGHPCDMDALSEIAKPRGIHLLEDCAQAHGAEFRGRRVGAIGTAGTFSFYPGKNLGAYGDAGAITTNDAALAKQCRMIANHGRVDKYDHEFEGRNSRLDGLQAAILSAKLAHLDAWIAHRNQVAAWYAAGLQGLPGITIPHVDERVRHAYHLFVIRSGSRDALQAYLTAAGVQTGIHYPVALPDLKAYAYLKGAEGPPLRPSTAGDLLSLPIGEHLGKDDVERVVSLIREFASR